MAIELSNAVALLVVGIILIQGLWLSYLTHHMFSRARGKRERERQRDPDIRDTVIEDVFLLHRSGLLIRHLTRRLKPQADSDILTSMLRAVQEFVRDSFREEEGELEDMTFGELRISICSGQHVVLAAVVRGARPEDMIDQLRAAVEDVEDNHEERIADWDGRLDSVDFVDLYLKRLLEGGYEEREEAAPEPPLVRVREVP